MTGLLFPIVGPLVVFLVAVPLLTLAARAAFKVAPRAKGSIETYADTARLALIAAPTLGPLIWLLSAALHQSEEGAAPAACVVNHIKGDLCEDVVLFGLILCAVLGLGIARPAARSRWFTTRSSTLDTRAAAAKVQRICAGHPALARLCPKVDVVEQGSAPVCTRGLLRPRIEVEVAVVRALATDALEAVLLHELEHTRARDPLRLFVAQTALAINPLSGWLAPHLARYRFAREVLCDRRAVQHGADPLALAQSIVCVAGARPVTAAAVAPLGGGHGLAGIQVRVQLLLGYAARCPGPPPYTGPVDALSSLVALLVTLPHVTGTGLLDLLHLGVERTALLLGLG